MKKYIKPTLEVVQLRVREKLANNTTVYDMSATDDSYALDTLALPSSL